MPQQQARSSPRRDRGHSRKTRPCPGPRRARRNHCQSVARRRRATVSFSIANRTPCRRRIASASTLSASSRGMRPTRMSPPSALTSLQDRSSAAGVAPRSPPRPVRRSPWLRALSRAWLTELRRPGGVEVRRPELGVPEAGASDFLEQRIEPRREALRLTKARSRQLIRDTPAARHLIAERGRDVARRHTRDAHRRQRPLDRKSYAFLGSWWKRAPGSFLATVP